MNGVHFSTSGRLSLLAPPQPGQDKEEADGPEDVLTDEGAAGTDGGDDADAGDTSPLSAPARRPVDDDRRIDALLAQGVLDTPADDEFDDFVEIGRRAFGTRICAINFIDRDRQWAKSLCGLEMQEIHRDSGLCAHTILQSQNATRSSFRGALPKDLLVILDTLDDPRCMHSELVHGKHQIRFYAGHALCTNRRNQRHAIGTLCIMDTAPRTEFSTSDVSMLAVLAEAVMSKLEATRPMASGPLASPWQDGGIDERVKILQKCIAVTTRDVAESALKNLAEVLRPRVYQAGQIITKRGEPGDSMFFVVMGQVAVELDGQRLQTHGALQSFGEIALVNVIKMRIAGVSAEEASAKSKRGADVVAMERCELLELGCNDARELIRNAPNLWFTLQEIAKRRAAKIDHTNQGSKPG